MMTSFLQKLLRVGVIIEAMFKWVWEGIAPIFFSKDEAARRASGKFERLKRQEFEAERLDRLRYPENYQGR